MSWSSKWFYFLVISFLLFTVAGGYSQAWKQIFTKSVSNSNIGAIAPIKPLTP